jgi:hypothetical protein
MKDMKRYIYFGLVIGITSLMCLQAGAISSITTTKAIDHSYGAMTLQNSLVSVGNPDGDDYTPKITRNSAGTLVVTYVQEISIFSKNCPVAWSADNGATWTTQFELDSLLFDMSGVLQSPDMCFIPGINQFYFTSIDPVAEQWNNVMFFIDGDIANAEEALGYALSGTGSENYMYAAGANTQNWAISATTEDGYNYIQLYGLGWFTYPDFEYPPVMGGFYYDGNSEHHAAPSAELEMATNSNRIFLVSEQTDEGKIQIKSTVNDEALLTNGESQNGMDKYADIEQWPGEFIADGTDPDVSGSGNRVCVVYCSENVIYCASSTCDAGTYEPGFDWQISTVHLGGQYPAVSVSGNNVKVAYVAQVQGQYNVYIRESTDGGLTWGEAVQVNDAEGSAVAEVGCVDINDLGIVWVDNRNGAKDIYAAKAGKSAIIEISGITGGFGVGATIANTGDADATGVDVSITIDASIMIIGGEVTDTLDITAGSSESISSGFILGFGPADITIEAGGVVETASGTVLGPFVIGL